ncbi:MAG TPA: NAD(P)-dependent oxidoreductase [Pirellulales bacterium]|nr:NAD(P)-dependent oxidoreductase [Pirellulales bacterium]
MNIAVTGATGFLGRHIVAALAEHEHCLRCWHRPNSDRGGFEAVAGRIQWLVGELGDDKASRGLVEGCDAVIHAALDHPGGGFRGGEGEIVSFIERNVVGTLRLIEAARAAGVRRFVFISTCAVHERILDGRPLDETHPLWPTSHYGAHKAAIEKFVHSYGYGMGYPICALRPTGIYGLARPARDSKWFDLVRSVVQGEAVECRRGGKEVHAADVAEAVEILLAAPAERIRGEAFNCYDTYISEWDVAHLAQEISGSKAAIRGSQTVPKNQIRTEKLRALGMEFGGRELLRQTIGQMVDAVRAA